MKGLKPAMSRVLAAMLSAVACHGQGANETTAFATTTITTSTATTTTATTTALTTTTVSTTTSLTTTTALMTIATDTATNTTMTLSTTVTTTTATTETATALTTTTLPTPGVITDATGTDYSDYSVPVSVITQSISMAVDPGVLDKFISDPAVAASIEKVVANISGVQRGDSLSTTLKKATSAARRLNTGTKNVQADTTIILPEDAPQPSGGAPQIAQALNGVSASDLASQINTQLSSDIQSQSYAISVTDVGKATASIVQPTAASQFVCEASGCSFGAYPEGQYWRFHKQGGLTTKSKCERDCTVANDCTGFEIPTDGSYCVFWLHSACDITSNPPGYSSWSGGSTCTKMPQYTESESRATGHSAWVSFAMLLVSASVLAEGFGS